MTSPDNPFAPPSLQSEPLSPATETARRPTLLRSSLTWLTVCAVAAAPSFYWGWTTIAQDQAAAMLTGVLIFVVIYITVDQSSLAAKLRSNRAMRISLRITYGIRIAASVVFPAGMILDMFCGMLSISLVGQLTQLNTTAGDGFEGMQSAGFGACLAITLTQGILLNCVLAGLAALIFGITTLVIRAND